MYSIPGLSKWFQSSAIGTFLALLTGAVVWLAFENKALSSKVNDIQAAATLQIVEHERQCNKDKEDLRRELIEKYKADNEKLEKLTADFRQLKRKR